MQTETAIMMIIATMNIIMVPKISSVKIRSTMSKAEAAPALSTALSTSHHMRTQWLPPLSRQRLMLQGDSGGRVPSGWNDLFWPFHSQAVSAWQRVLGRIGWVEVQDGGTSKSMSTQPRYATTRVTLYMSEISAQLTFITDICRS